MTKKEYLEQIEWHGSYPCVVTTDGDSYRVEFRHNYDQWKHDDVQITYVQDPDGFPTYSRAEKIRRFVKRCKKLGIAESNIQNAVQYLD